MTRAILLSVLWTVLGCAGTNGGASMPATTTAPLAGDACDTPGRPCRCAQDGERLGDVPEGKKRFEVRLSPVSDSETAVTIAGLGTLARPSGSPGDRCFYVDLAAGRTHAVTVHGRGDHRERGLAIGYSIREYNPRARPPGMYTILRQECGDATSVCPHAAGADWAADYRSGNGDWDPCSSTRVLRYRAEGGFYEGHATDVDISFDLQVYEFAPRRMPGGEGCGGAP